MAWTLQSLSPERQSSIDVPTRQAQQTKMTETPDSQGKPPTGQSGIAHRFFEGEIR
jgi:hypothetical protein